MIYRVRISKLDIGFSISNYVIKNIFQLVDSKTLMAQAKFTQQLRY